MTASLSPFQLERVLFVRSVVIAIPEFNPEEAAMALPVNNIDVRRDDKDPALLLGSMRTQVNVERQQSIPYEIDMECVCSLRQIDHSMDEATALRGATITAHSILYGAIREATTWITARQPWGPLTLGLSVLATKPPEAGSPAAPEAP